MKSQSEIKSIIERCSSSKDLRYQKDVSYLLMKIRQAKHETNKLLVMEKKRVTQASKEQ